MAGQRETILATLAEYPNGIDGRSLRKLVKGKASSKMRRLADLIAEGCAFSEDGLYFLTEVGQEDVKEIPPDEPKAVGEEEKEEKAPKAAKGEDTGPKTPPIVKARFVGEVMEIDSRLLIFYELARQKWPHYDATPSEFIFDVVVIFCQEHADELGIGEILKGIYEPLEVRSG